MAKIQFWRISTYLAAAILVGMADNAFAGGFVLIQGNANSVTSGTTIAVTLTSNPTTGNLVTCGVNFYRSAGGGTTISSAKDGMSPDRARHQTRKCFTVCRLKIGISNQSTHSISRLMTLSSETH